MPTATLQDYKGKYLLYDNKLCTGDEAAESVEHLKQSMKKIGYEVVVSRGDSLNTNSKL